MKCYRAVYLSSYPVGKVRYQDVDFDPARFRADPEGYLDWVERQLPEGAYLIKVEEKPSEEGP